MRACSLIICWILLAGCDGDLPRDDAGGRDATVADAGPLPDGAQPDGGGTPDGGPPDNRLQDGPVCSAGGWCWETPLPAGGLTTDLWSPSPGHAIAASSTHTFHVDPTGTIRHAAPPGQPLAERPLFGVAPDDLWSMGLGSAIHFDGTEWSEVAGVTYASGMHGAAGDDIWAVGGNDIYHYDGSAWTSVGEPDATHGFTDVWAVGGGAAVVVGSAPSAIAWIVRADGTTTDLGFPASSGAMRVYASSADDVWVPAGDARLYHLEGGTWSVVSSGRIGLDIWGSGPDDVWITFSPNRVDHWNGTEMESFTIDARGVYSVAGAGPNDVWVSDTDGGLHHYDGTTWSSTKTPLRSADFTMIAAVDEVEAWAIGASVPGPSMLARRSADGTWSLETPPTAAALTGVARAGSETMLFAFDGSFRREAGAWTPLTGGARLRDACATADGSVWGVGTGVARYADGVWTSEPPAVALGELDRIDCIGDEAWAVTAIPIGRTVNTIVRFTEGSWGRVGLASIATLPVRAAHATGDDDAWLIAGDASRGSVVMRWDGIEWREMRFGGSADVIAVGGTSPADVWLAGEAGLARRWDGSTMTAIDAAGAPDFPWIHARGDGTARAVAEAGAIWEYDASGWREISPPLDGIDFSSNRLLDAAFAGEDVYAAGNANDPLRWRAGTWERLPGFFSAERVAAGETAGAWFVDSVLGRVGRWNGTSVEQLDPSVSADDLVVIGSDVFALGGTSVRRFSAGSFVTEHLTEGDVRAFMGTSADSLWIASYGMVGLAGRHEVWRKSGGAWSLVPEITGVVHFTSDATGNLFAVRSDLSVWRRGAGGFTEVVPAGFGLEGYGEGAHVFAEDDVWGLVAGGLFRWNGTEWTTLAEPIGGQLTALDATPSGSLFAIGSGGAIVRRAAR